MGRTPTPSSLLVLNVPQSPGLTPKAKRLKEAEAREARASDGHVHLEARTNLGLVREPLFLQHGTQSPAQHPSGLPTAQLPNRMVQAQLHKLKAKMASRVFWATGPLVLGQKDSLLPTQHVSEEGWFSHPPFECGNSGVRVG